MRKLLAGLALLSLLFSNPAAAQSVTAIGASGPCSAFGTTTGTCAQGGVITGAGPTGGATTVPVITYNSAGQLTAVTTAATGVTTVGTAAVGQIPGTATNDSAAAGNVGEDGSANIPDGTPTSLTNGAAKSITSVTLQPGEYLVWGTIRFNGAAATTVTYLISNVFTTQDTIGTLTTCSRADNTFTNAALFAINYVSVSNCPQVIKVATATTQVMYLTALAGFAVSTANAAGTIYWTRLR